MDEMKVSRSEDVLDLIQDRVVNPDESHTEFLARGSYENEWDWASRYDAATMARVIMSLRNRITNLEESSHRHDDMCDLKDQ